MFWPVGIRLRGLHFCLQENSAFNKIPGVSTTVSWKRKGQPVWAALRVIRGAWSLRLGQIVTERSPEHVVDALCAPAGVCCAPRAGPEIAFESAVLKTIAEAAFWSPVHVVPVTEREFLHVLVLVAAVCRGRRREAIAAVYHTGAGHRFAGTTRHIAPP